MIDGTVMSWKLQKWSEKMSSMKEMASQYRAASAKLALRIREKEQGGADEYELRQLRQALKDMREIQRTLDGYYDVTRSEIFTSFGWTGRGPSQDDH